MSIDVKNSGTNEEYVRTQAAGTFDIDGISEDMSALLGDSRSIIEDFYASNVPSIIRPRSKPSATVSLRPTSTLTNIGLIFP